MKRTKTTRILLCCLSIMLMLALVPSQAFAAAASIKLNKTKVSVSAGDTVKLKATVKGKNSKVTWKSSNSDIAEVNGKGKVTGKNTGKATITAKANGKTAKCTVTVTNTADYKNLYNEFLSESKVSAGSDVIAPDYYYMLDIDGKNVPELIVTDTQQRVGATTFYYIYTVKKQKVFYLGSYTYEYLSRPSFSYVKEYKGILSGSFNRGVSAMNLFTISGSKVAPAYHARETLGMESYYIGNDSNSAKQVSKQEYDEYCSKYFSGETQYNLLENTAANRSVSFS